MDKSRNELIFASVGFEESCVLIMNSGRSMDQMIQMKAAITQRKASQQNGRA